MAATANQKLKTPLILGVPLASIEVELDALSADKLTLLDEAIAKYDALRFRAAVLNVDGVSVDPEDERKLVRDYVASLLEIANPFAGYVATVMTAADYEDTFQ